MNVEITIGANNDSLGEFVLDDVGRVVPAPCQPGQQTAVPSLAAGLAPQAGRRNQPADGGNGGYDIPRKRALVYIAGPFSGGTPTHNVNDACKVWDEFRKDGIVAICPHWSALQDMVLPLDYESWLAYDFALILHCSAVFRMPGESSGANRECELAAALGIPVFDSVDACVEYIRGEDAWPEAMQPVECDTCHGDGFAVCGERVRLCPCPVGTFMSSRGVTAGCDVESYIRAKTAYRKDTQ